MKLTRSIHMLFLLTGFSTAISGQYQVSGNITEDVTWSGTVTVIGDVTVKNSATLTIKPGTEVLFQNYDRLTIQGTIRAMGTRDSMILFSPEDSTGWSDFTDTTGGWQGVFIGSTAQNINVFQNCLFRFGKGYQGGALNTNAMDNIFIDSCIFFVNYASKGGAIDCSGSDINISNTVFYGNIADERGGAILMNGASPHIDACLFANNYSGQVGGAIKSQYTEALLTNNIFVNNESFSGGVFLFTTNSNPVLINNTICNNKAYEGGAVMMYEQCYPVFVNNIIYGNENNSGLNQFTFDGLTPEPELLYNDIEGGFDDIGLAPGATYSGVYEENIDLSPDFASATTAAGLVQNGSTKTWKLKMVSPCINAGLNNTGKVIIEKDYEGNARIRYSYVDQGAREFYNDGFNLTGNISSDLFITADTINVTGNVTINNGVTLGINPGAYVRFMDYYEIDVNGTFLAIGSEADNIIFTRDDTLGFSDFTVNTGGWKGINFWQTDATNDSSRFVYSRFEYGKAVDGSFNNGGAIRIGSYNKVLIDHCTFENNVADVGGAVRPWSAPIAIKYSVFRNNIAKQRGGAIECLLSNALIENCLFEYNTAGNEGGAVNLLSGRSTVRDNTIRYNTSLGKGGGLNSDDSYPEVSGNKVYYNTAEGNGGGLNFGNSAYISKNFIANNTSGNNGGGIQAFFENNAVITNNIIVNNSSLRGGGLYIRNKKPEFVNNTVAHNYAESQGGGIMLAGIDPYIFNSILWGNRAGTQNSQLDFGAQAAPSLLFCNIQGGRDSIEAIATGEIGQYIKNIDSLPCFMEPSEGAGAEFDGYMARWGLKATSPCINRGTIPIGNLEVLDTDILDNPRINYDRIDIGAIENQGTDPVVTLHPFNYFKCEGKPAGFKVLASDSVYFQWQLEGIDIPGATSNILVIDSITLSDQGTYICKMWNAYGQVESNPALLITKLPPAIWQEPEAGWVKRRDLTVLKFGHQGTEPLQYRWFKDGKLIEGANYPELRFLNTDYQHEGIYTCKVHNSCGIAETDETALYVAPEICMVTVDTVDGKNLVVWENESSAPVTQFNVYREGIIAGKYDLLGSVMADSLSVFVDEAADPLQQAYFYKITAVDTADLESDIDLCDPHKTVHLIVTINPETQAVQMDWDEYIGFPYGTYNIYRSVGCTQFSLYNQIASSSTAWTDTDPLEGLVCYRVGVQRPVECLSGGALKAGAGPYSHSLSNTDDNRLQTTGVASVYRKPGSIVVYPNPFTDYTTIRFSNPENKTYKLVIRDLSGKVVRSEETVQSGEFVLYRKNMNPGYYFIELSGEKLFRGKFVVE